MRMPTPKGNARMTMTTRTNVASISRYSAMPPHTPLMTRLVRLRSRRPDIDGLPSRVALVEGREDHGRERRERDRRARGERADRDDLLGDHGRCRQHEAERHAEVDVRQNVERRDRDAGLAPDAHPDESRA